MGAHGHGRRRAARSRAPTSRICCSREPTRAGTSSRFAPRSAPAGGESPASSCARASCSARSAARSGLALAYAGLELLAAFAPANLPRVEDIAVGPPVLAFAVAAALVVEPRVRRDPRRQARVRQRLAARRGARGASASRERNRTRSALIVVQVALALVLLVGAGLMIRTFQALTAVDPGFTRSRARPGRAHLDSALALIPERGALDARLPRGPRTNRRAAGREPRPAIGGGVPVEAAREAAARAPRSRSRTGPTCGEAPPIRSFGRRLARLLRSARHALRRGPRPRVGRRRSSAAPSRSSPRISRASSGASRKRRSASGSAGTTRSGPGLARDRRRHAGRVLRSLYQPPPPSVYDPIVHGRATACAAITYVIRSDRAGTESFANEVRQAVWASNPDLTVYEMRTMQEHLLRFARAHVVHARAARDRGRDGAVLERRRNLRRDLATSSRSARARSAFASRSARRRESVKRMFVRRASRSRRSASQSVSPPPWL